MQQSGENIISRLKLNLKFGSGEDAGTVRARADAVADGSVIPVLERVVDEYGGSGIGEIDSLELDLGQVTEDELPDVLERTLRNRLDRIVRGNTGGLVPDDDIFTVECSEGYGMPGNATTPDSYRKALVNYLSKPSVPWNSESGFNPVELIVKAVEGMDRKSLEKWIVTELTEKDSVRLLRLEEMLVAGLSSFVTVQSDGENGAGEREVSSEPEYGRVPEMRGGGFSEENGDGQVRSLLREMLKITRRIIPSDEVGRVLSFRAAAWKKYLLRSGIIIGAEGEDDDSEGGRIYGNRRTWSGGRQKRELESESGTGSGAENLLKGAGETVGQGVVLRSGNAEMDEVVLRGNREENDEGGRGRTGRKPAAGIDGMNVENSASAVMAEWAQRNERTAGVEGVWNVDGKVEERTDGKAGKEKIAEGKEEKTAGPAEDMGTLVYGEKAVGENDVWMPSDRESESILDRIFVSDAGLVLIHPFIRMLFRNMELVDEKGEFVSWPARIHAVHLLRYVSGLGGEHFDHILTLEKILCGLPAGYVVPVSWKPGQKDREETEGLLRAVISYWTTLSKSSPEALQRGFLQRPGSVETDEGTYIVRVEGSAMDILMDDLPWEFSMIVLPWLKQPILVEWQR